MSPPASKSLPQRHATPDELENTDFQPPFHRRFRRSLRLMPATSSGVDGAFIITPRRPLCRPDAEEG